MSDACPLGFDTTLLSGLLDRELTQGDRQRVELHLEDCPQCRRHYDELSRIREATMTTQFTVPDDRQWDERPSAAGSALSRGFGWILVLVWAVGITAFGVYQLWIDAENIWIKLAVFGGLGGFALLFISVLLDRIRTARNDPYAEVDK
jgi:predicted anti-sigma-YlaC factor YlaD